MVVYMADGSMVKYSGNRKVTLSFYCLDNTFEKQITLPISDDGVIRYTYRPTGDGCITYRLEVSLNNYFLFLFQLHQFGNIS